MKKQPLIVANGRLQRLVRCLFNQSCNVQNNMHLIINKQHILRCKVMSVSMYMLYVR